MPNPRVLIVDEMHPSLPPMLAEIGWEADYLPHLGKAELLAIIGQYEGLVVRSKLALDQATLAQAERLRFIARAGAGTDQIDTDEAARRGIAVLNAPEGNRDAVGEHTVGLLLAVLNRLHLADREVRQRDWQRERNRGRELGSLTVGLVGYGNMGQAFAKRLVGFGCPVLAYDKYHTGWGRDPYAREATLPDLFAQADVLSLHVPLTPETRGMANLSFFEQFKNNIYFLNTARGEIAPLADLAQGLASGKLLGAGLDVLENEKLATLTPAQSAAFDYLAQSDKVVFSPHVAGWTQESYQRINEVLVQKIAAFWQNALLLTSASPLAKPFS
jgi:D-3-phosphoglycerate dehydrogenase / 2-oxoglutarate reductase